MGGVEVPVDPLLDSEGRLRVLLPLFPKNPDFARPVPLQALEGDWDVDMEARAGRADSFAKLGVSDAFTAQASGNQLTTIWDALIGKKAVVGTQSPGSMIYETFWGVGLRVALTFTSADTSLATNVATVAATSELHGLDIQYQIKAVGLGAPELATLLETIPPMGRFDLDAYTLLKNARTTITKVLLDKLKSLDDARKILRPVIIKLAQTPFDDELDDAAAYRFAMQSIAAGLSQSEAVARLKGIAWKARPERVEAIYQELQIQGAPSAQAKATATKWLSTGP